MDYSGKIIRKTPVVPTQQSASGVWTLDDALQATKSNTWPIANVPDPMSRSLRFRASASAFLNRTPASASNRKTWTWSGWVKRGRLGTDTHMLFDEYSASNDNSVFTVYFDSNNLLVISGWTSTWRITSQVFRDPSAWYHIVIALDTTQATANDRLKLYVNGSQVTSFGTTTNPSLNADLGINQAATHTIGRYANGSLYYYDGYLTEINFIDGQALTPSSFGGTNAVTGVWEPRPYTGTYGTNGFLLTFSDITSTATLGNDTSGNNNIWTTNNISLTAGSTYDSMLDVPTQWIAYGTGSNEVRGNYCVWNPLNSGATISQGNLLATNASYSDASGSMSMAMSGKYYAEFTYNSATSSDALVGITLARFNGSGQSDAFRVVYLAGGSIERDGVATPAALSGYPTYTTGDIIGITLDVAAGTITFYKNNTFVYTLTTSVITENEWRFFVRMSNRSFTANFGQRPFSYTPPAGFLSLCTTNLPSPTILQGNQYFDATTYTGNGGTLAVTNSGSMQPDWAWIKMRSGTDFHILQDSVRGVGKNLNTNNTNAETGNSGDLITSFNSNGFTVNNTYLGGANTSTNGNGSTYVAWQWRASNATAVTNTAGSITSTVSANPTAGFSIVTYTGTGANATVGHGLGVAPSMFIVKSRSNTRGWQTYHANVGNDRRLLLNANDFVSSASAIYWNNTTPTSTVFSLGTDGNGNASGENFVAYCFSQIAGYSAFGRYDGNGSADGPFVFTGFRPAFVMVKRTDSTGSWAMEDKSRLGYNPNNQSLYANSSSAEDTNTPLDFVSNGFKFRAVDTTQNASGGGYIYMAFAENPFKNALAR